MYNRIVNHQGYSLTKVVTCKCLHFRAVSKANLALKEHFVCVINKRRLTWVSDSWLYILWKA